MGDELCLEEQYEELMKYCKAIEDRNVQLNDRAEAAEYKLTLKTAEAEGLGSLLLDVQQDCINLRKKLATMQDEYKPYLQALIAVKARHPDGYTIVDFQAIWLSQEKERNEKLTAKLTAAREEGRRERTREIAEDFCDFRTGKAENYKYTLEAELKAIYPECFDKIALDAGEDV